MTPMTRHRTRVSRLWPLLFPTPPIDLADQVDWARPRIPLQDTDETSEWPEVQGAAAAARGSARSSLNPARGVRWIAPGENSNAVATRMSETGGRVVPRSTVDRAITRAAAFGLRIGDAHREVIARSA